MAVPTTQVRQKTILRTSKDYYTADFKEFKEKQALKFGQQYQDYPDMLLSDYIKWKFEDVEKVLYE